MEIFKRDEAIKALLSDLDIPRLKHWFDPEQGIGPYDPEFFEKSFERREEHEREAETALHKMTDLELFQLLDVDERGRFDSFAREHFLVDPPPWYAGGFGVSVYKPDYEHWAKADFWTFEEATCLSLGFTPERLPDYKGQYSPYETVKFFKGRLFLIQRAKFSTKTNDDKVAPESFVSWAESKMLDIPAELIKAFDTKKAPQRPKMLSSVDKRQYDSALKVILGLLSSQFGYRKGPATSEMTSDIASGLEELGLSLDRKTLTKSLGEAVTAKKRFEVDQKKRDDKDV